MLWSLQSHYYFIMSGQLHLVLGDAADRSKQPFIQTNSNAAPFRSKMEDYGHYKAVQILHNFFQKSRHLNGGCKKTTYRKRPSTATQKMARRLASLLFLPKALSHRWASKLWKGVAVWKEWTAWTQCQQELLPLIPIFKTSFPVKTVQHCSFKKKISWC